MIELRKDLLEFAFPEVHEDAVLRVQFVRTLRIPDDGKRYPLPAGLGSFPLRHVDDFARRVPESWIDHGGVMMPMYQSEALWIAFHAEYPFAVKVAAGKVCAVTGDPYQRGLHREPQDYLVTPPQPWLDGFCVERGVIRQFVAMPLGAGYTVEEQVTGRAEHGGLQLHVYPLKAEHYEPPQWATRGLTLSAPMTAGVLARASHRIGAGMGLAPGGRMRQELYVDRRPVEQWDQAHGGRCFVHLANSETWRAITGEAPPQVPFTRKQYEQAGVPWFDFYAEGEKGLPGSSILTRLKSVIEMGKENGEEPVLDNASMVPERVRELRRGLREGEVRDGGF